MLVRDVQEKDKSQLFSLYREFAIESQQAPVDLLDIGKNWLVICEDKNKVIGYGAASRISYCAEDYIQAEHIYVTPAYRGTKAAHMIYRSFRKWSKLQARPIIMLSEPTELNMWLRKGYKPLRYMLVKELK